MYGDEGGDTRIQISNTEHWQQRRITEVANRLACEEKLLCYSSCFRLCAGIYQQRRTLRNYDQSAVAHISSAIAEALNAALRCDAEKKIDTPTHLEMRTRH